MNGGYTTIYYEFGKYGYLWSILELPIAFLSTVCFIKIFFSLRGRGLGMGERACYTNFNLVQIMSAEYKGFGNQREETFLYQRTKVFFKLEDLSLCHKLKLSNPYNYAF